MNMASNFQNESHSINMSSNRPEVRYMLCRYWIDTRYVKCIKCVDNRDNINKQYKYGKVKLTGLLRIGSTNVD